jgi:sugar lactone lactonase YvrE
MIKTRIAAGLLLILGACSAETSTTTSTPPPATTAATTTTIAATTEAPRESGAEVSTLVAELEASTGGVAVDASGNVYVANIGPAPRRRGTKVLRVTPEGDVSLFVDDERLRGPSGNTVDAEGNLYQSAYTAGAIFRVTPQGDVEPLAERGVRGPMGLLLDTDHGGLFAADCDADTVLHVTDEGEVSVFADDRLLDCPTGLTRDEAGNLYVSNFSDGRVLRVGSDGGVTEVAVVPGDNNGHLAYANGLLYVVGRGANQIFTVTLDGTVEVLAGSGERGVDDGAGLDATFSLPNGIAIASDGAIYVNQVAGVTGSNNFPVAVRVIRLEG